ncbi:pantoate--beta-alanine ligase [Rothia koreensis]|jgi:pantoate--beta-alanine ligase|uniref:pantoate--beta-alanine ligase n=1 Tax=Rothia koreensis TaxID=592378 RepID=UPI0037C6C47A
MTGELFIARTLEEFSAHISQRMGDAEARIHAAEAETLSAQRSDPDAEPTTPRVATLGFVPTMGALHDGHATLIERAREQNDVVAVSIFVNPLQFGPGEDYDKYPRQPDEDLALLRKYGVDIVFIPELEVMYPGGEPLVRVSSGRLGTMFEGAARPGHFDGVLTVVNKLFNVVVAAAGPHRGRAYFGQKDAQQVALVQRMVADFAIPLVVCPVAIVRDDDGLAMSSRNSYLDPEERKAALVLSRTLALLREEGLSRGYAGIDVDAARERISDRDGVDLEYLEIVDPKTFEAPVENSERATALAAIRVGGTRLIDNMDVI